MLEATINKFFDPYSLGSGDTALVGGSRLDQSGPILGCLQSLEYSRGLKAAMHHAVGAPWIFAYPVPVPDILVEKFFDVFNMLVGQWVAGFPPSHHRVSGVGPSRALVFPFPL